MTGNILWHLLLLASVLLGAGVAAGFGSAGHVRPVGIRHHKIRHQRHLTGSYKNLINLSDNNNKCTVKLSEDVRFAQDGCPEKECINHNSCWEEFGATKLCICDPHLCGLRCIDYNERCLLPKRPVNGRIFVKDLRVGDQVEYSCDPGYALKGPRKRYCQANLKLSGKDPECTNQTNRCFSPPYIPNTEADNGTTRDDYKNKENVKIVCKSGFKDLQNSFTNAICDGNVWRYSPLNCERINCDKLDDPLNGRTMYSNYNKFQSVAIQFCNDGYYIECSVINQKEKKDCKRVCEADRSWSSSAAICKQILCPSLKSPENGVAMGYWYTVNSIMNFKCNKGYQLAGSYLRKCQYNGRWDGTDAVCNVRDCGPPPKTPFATVVFKNTTHGSTAIYICSTNTTMVGDSPTLTCGEAAGQSAWIPKPVPQCMRHCPPITVNYANIMAEDKNSKSYFLLNGAVKHGVQIKVICDHGFELNQQEMPACNNGSLSYIPQCVEASCRSRPASIKFSTVRFYDLRHNSIARYYCHTGYRMRNTGDNLVENAPEWVTTFDIKCIMGNWTKADSRGCQPTLCINPLSPINGDVYLQGKNDRTRLEKNQMKLEHNRMVRYECSPDYRLIGPKMAICLNGQWSPPETPKCEYIMHDELPLLWLFYPSSPIK